MTPWDAEPDNDEIGSPVSGVHSQSHKSSQTLTNPIKPDNSGILTGR